MRVAPFAEMLNRPLALTAIGIIIGLGAAMVLTRVMSALLFGVSPADPVTYAVVSGVLAPVALLATYLSARRASHVDPIVALRAGSLDGSLFGYRCAIGGHAMRWKERIEA
jgi:ABC-type antimicrobial peptide transport system permease subunit